MDDRSGRRTNSPSRRLLTRSVNFILFGFLLFLGHAAIPSGAEGASPVSWGFAGDTFELRILGAAGEGARAARTVSPPKVVVDAALPFDPQSGGEFEVGDVAVRRVRVGGGPLGTRVVVDLAYPLPEPLVHVEDGAVVVTLRRVFRTVDETRIAPGVWFGQVRGGKADGPLSVKYLKVDLTHPGVKVYPALAAGERFGLETVREGAKRLGALAAVNGGYFHWSGRPLGLLVLEGKLVSDDIHGRTAFALREDGTAFIGPLEASLWLESSAGERLPLDGINRPRLVREAVAYTSHYGPLPAARGDRLYFLYHAALPPLRWNEVPDAGLVVEYPAGDPRFARIAPGERWELRYELSPGAGGPVRFALGGGPALVVAGEVQVRGADEGFQPDVLLGRAPRTALGLTADGKLLLVVVDGRAEGFSVGMSLEELAWFMKELGAVSAMNLDGGGSATLVVRGRVLSRPSGGEERAVASLIVVDAAR